jgi:RHS repeat-associated protein
MRRHTARVLVVASVLAVVMQQAGSLLGVTPVTPVSAFAPGPITFGSPVAYANGDANASEVGLAVDSAGGFDAVTANAPSTSVSYLAAQHGAGGNPDGTLAQPAVVSAASPAPSALAVGDLNGDGKPDLVVATGSNTLSVMMGQGGGVFGPVTTLQTIPPGSVGTPQVVFARIADVNNDQKKDVILGVNTGCVCQAETAVYLALGNGDGTFQPGNELPVPEASLGSNPGETGLAVADVNNDHLDDIVVAIADTGHGFDDGQVWVLINSGGGTFQPAASVADVHGIRSDGPGEAMAVADVNGDGNKDIITTQQPLTEAPRGVHVFLGTGTGTFNSGTYFADPSQPNIRSLALADMNGDGAMDVVTAVSSSSGNGISVYPGNGDGTLGSPTLVTTPFLPQSMEIADLNNDAKPDLVLSTRTSGANVHVMLNQTVAGLNGGPVAEAWARGGGPPCASCAAQQEEASRDWGTAPITLPFGTFWHTFTDLVVPGRGYPLAVTQTYNSSDAATDHGLGYGWASNLLANVVVTGTSPDQVATVTGENGSQSTFTQSGNGWAALPRDQATLVRNADGSWTLTRHAVDTLTFNSSGQVTAEQDLNGNMLVFGYTSGHVSSIGHDDPAHSDLRSFQITWSGGNPDHIVSVVDNNAGLNRTTAFSYDADGQLTDINWGTPVGRQLRSINEHFEYETAAPLSHRLTGMRDGRGFWTTQAYDATGRVISQTVDPTAKDASGLNRVTSFDYSVPNQVTVTDPRGNRTAETYSEGMLVSKTAGVGTPQAATWQYDYDASSLGMTSVLDPNHHTVTTTYDTYGNVLTRTDALQRQTVSNYSAADAPYHQPTTVTDALGVATTYTYDSRRNLVSTSRPLTGTSPLQTQTVTRYRDDASHPDDVTRVLDARGFSSYFTYDADGDVVAFSDPLSHETTAAYNQEGWKTSSVSPNGNLAGCNCASQYTTSYDYLDPSSSVVSYFGDVGTVTDPLGHLTRTSHDADRNVTSAVDPDGNATTSTYDAAGELTLVTRPDQTTVGTDYWPDGTVRDQVDGLGHATSYAYDALGRETSVTDPLQRATSYTYDGAGNMLTTTDPQQQVTTYGHDAADQVTSITYSDGTTPNVSGVQYDLDGQRTSMTDGTGTSTWQWDSLHRMAQSVDGAGNTVTYGYDLGGNHTSLTYPGVATPVTYQYDAASRVSSLVDLSGNTSYFAYDLNDNLTNESLPNQDIDFFTYDHANRVSNVSFTIGNLTTYATMAYSRDNNGQVTSEADTGLPGSASTAYTYTALNQVSTATTAQFGYDAADNPVTLSGQLQTFDAANELCRAGGVSGTCTSGGGTQYTDDNRGDRTTGVNYSTDFNTQSATYTYDQANRLVSDQGGWGLTYTYNGDGLRTKKEARVSRADQVSSYTWDVHGSLPQLLSDGTSQYVYGPGGIVLESVGASTSYYHHDSLGSTRALTDSTGSAVATSTYTAYGTLAGSTGTVTTPFMFAGQYQDSENGLYYLRTRYYDPYTAQFLSRDPLVALTREPYGYVAGDPLNAIDPTGLDNDCDLVPRPWDLEHSCAALGAASVLSNAVESVGNAIATPVYAPANDQDLACLERQAQNEGTGWALPWLDRAGTILAIGSLIDGEGEAYFAAKALSEADDASLTVQEFIGKYLQGSVNRKMPGEYLNMTVKDALASGNSTVRKLLTNSKYRK